ncbi:dihydrofolate reductase family protein [Flavihumibacter sp. UBA7668]|uniref:dihydrofolate reductase family protein n=1 Tax=Flavihumibacter sp. UBA7668 TaxID=1946542 RepID=UPI0025C21405|nr:dihydrofolate reductase family protein [Flavihumibacter sp. UBA7668]
MSVEKNKRLCILYIAMSLDGYIAGKDDNLDFLSKVEVAGEDYGYAAFQQEVDTLIWGRRTYDKMLTFGIDFPHADKKCYVISATKTGSDENVEFAADPVALVQRLKTEPGRHIYCDGGGGVVKALLDAKLIDRLIVSVIPHLLGDGIRLFRDGRPEQQLVLHSSTPYASGLVQLRYDVN